MDTMTEAMPLTVKIDDLLARILERARAIIPFDSGCVALYNAESDLLTPYVYQTAGSALPLPETIPLGEGLVGQVAATRRPALVTAARDDSRCAGHDVHVQSELAAPMALDGKLLGVLYVSSARRDGFTDEHLAILCALADQAALVIDTMMLLAEAEAHPAETSLLLEITALAASTLEPGAILTRTLDLIREGLNVEKGAFLLYDRGSNTLVIRHGASFGFALPTHELRFPANDPTSQIAITFMAGAPYFANTTDSIRMDPAFTVRAGLHSLLCAPLRVQDHPLGVLLVANPQARLFTRQDASLLAALGSHIAVTLRNIELSGDTNARLRETEALQRIAVLTSATIDMDEMLTQVVRESAALLRVEAAMLLIPDPGGRFLTVHPPSLFGLSRTRPYPVWPLDGYGHLIHAYHTGLPFYSNAEIDDPIVGSPDAFGFAVRNVLTFPLNTRSRTLGVLSLFNCQDGAFDESHLELTRAIASQVAVSMESAQLFTAERERADLMALINQISQQLNAVIDLRGLLRQAAKSIHDLLGYEAVCILLTNEREGTVSIAARAANTSDLTVTEGYRFAVTQGIVGRAIRTQEAQNVPDLREDADRFVPYHAPQVVSCLTVPLRSGDRILGALDILSTRVSRFNKTDLMAMQTLAAQVATAIENARLYNQAQRRLLEQDIVHQIGQELTATLDYEALVNAVVRQMARALDATSCTVILYDAGQDALNVAAVYHHPAAEPVHLGGMVVAGRSDTIRQAIQIHYPVAISLADADVLPSQCAWLKEAKQQAQLVVPMITRGGVVGVVEWLDAQRPHAFDLEEVRLAQTLTTQAAIALENARLFHQAQRQARDQGFLRDVTTRFSRALVMNELLRQVTEAATAAIHADYAVVALLEHGQLTVQAAQPPHPPDFTLVLDQLNTPSPASATTWERLQGKSTLIFQPGRAVDDTARAVQAALSPSNTHLIAAIFQRQALIGVVEIVITDATRAFDAQDIELIEGLARQAGMAMENIHLVTELEQRAVELAEANRLKNEFLTNISHELRTPMNSIIGFSETLLSGLYGELGEKATNRIERILRNGRNLLALIDNLLDLSKIEAGKLELAIGPVNLSDELYFTSQAIESQVAAKGLSLDLDVPSSLPTLHTDSLRLRQILNNLLSNAVKFTHEGGITIRAGLDEEADPPRVWCAITDTGIGVGSGDQAIIFDEFRQVDGTTTREYEGTGLGLAITKKLLEMMGGSIEVASEPGAGSTFTFWLPIQTPGTMIKSPEP